MSVKDNADAKESDKNGFKMNFKKKRDDFIRIEEGICYERD